MNGFTGFLFWDKSIEVFLAIFFNRQGKFQYVFVSEI